MLPQWQDAEKYVFITTTKSALTQSNVAKLQHLQIAVIQTE